ncbi:MAG: prephenate dehydratase [Methanomicrobiales archaeon]
MTLFALGPEGTHSHDLALRVFDGDLILLPTIPAVCRAVATGEGAGVVPIENSETGGVGQTLRCLHELLIHITAEAYMPIRHHLASFCHETDIQTVYAHPQAHAQCSRFVDRLGVEVIHTSSTAASARSMESVPGAAAILSTRAASVNGIPLIHQDIQNRNDNITRFVRIENAPPTDPSPVKCSVIIDPKTDRTGLLCDLLGVFARHDINLTRIESLPSRRGMGSYLFFLDATYSPAMPDALDELRTMTDLRELGCYPRLEVV